MSPLSPSHGRVRFNDFEANLSSGELRKHGLRIKLQVQPFQVLQVLLEHPGEVVTREEFQKRIWPANTFVDFDHGLNNAVKKLRQALGDDDGKHRFIETLSKRGYRFIATLHPASDGITPLVSLTSTQHHHSVGRERERGELSAAFECAASGPGLLACVAGEPGIGKTTLVEDFLTDLGSTGSSFLLAKGRCSERLAGSEAYLPFLGALESLVRSDNGEIERTLRTVAPTWYAQVVPLSEDDPSDLHLREYVSSASQERVKREMGAFLYEITRPEPFVLFFDDVHWADSSTVDLLAYLATKFDSTRILVIASYRPSELLLSKHPFIGVKRDLQAHGACRDIEVQFLSTVNVNRYIDLEFPQNCFPPEFSEVIHSRTEGNPLFMVNLLRYLRERDVILKKEGDQGWSLAQSLPDLSRHFPDSIKSVIEGKIAQFSDCDIEVLSAAAVEGYEFDSTAIACVLQAQPMEVEERLERLDVISGFVKRVAEDEFFDRTLTVRYRFVHVLYQNMLYNSLVPARRVLLSGALAARLETFYGEKSPTIASQLGFLYETARNAERASDYFLIAAKNAQGIFANQEAVALAGRGLALVTKLPETPERTRKELGLQITMAFSLLFLRGYTTAEVQQSMAKARKLCELLGDTAQLTPVLVGLWFYYIGVPELPLARESAEHALQIARNANDPALLLGAHGILGVTLAHQGELAAGHNELEEGLSYYDPALHRYYLELFRVEPGIYERSESVRTLWMLGYPDQARRRSQETLVLARTNLNPPSFAYIHVQTAFLYQFLREPDKVREICEAGIALCNQHGVAQERSWLTLAYGWAIAKLGQLDEGISQFHAAFDAQLAQGNEVGNPQYLSFLAEVHLGVHQPEKGLKAVEDALAMSRRTGDCFYDAELWRLKGELLKMQGKTAEAEDCFQKAIEIARQQSAKSLELRAATSLARLWQKQRNRTEAHQLLGEIYSWFTEGFDTADLQEAASLLEELS